MRKLLAWLKHLAQGKTLATQILLYFLIASFVAVVAVGTFTYATAQRRIENQLRDRYTDDAGLITTYVANTIATAYFDIQLLSYNSVITSPASSLEEKLYEMEKTQWLHGLFEDITLYDSQGTALVSTGQGFDVLDRANRIVLNQVVEGSPNPFISDVQNIDDAENICIVFGAPVYDELLSGKWNTTWIISARMNLDQIWRLSDSLKIGKTGYIALVDSFDRYIAHPDKEMLSKPLANKNLSTKAGKLFSYREMQGGVQRTGLIGQTLSNPSWVDKGWRVVISQDTHEAFQALRSTLWLIMIVLVITLVFFVIVGLIVSQRLILPLRTLTKATQRIAIGDFSHRVAVSRRDEIGNLGQAYNEMAYKLERRESDSKQLKMLKRGVARWSKVDSSLYEDKYLVNLASAILDTYEFATVWILLTKGQKLVSRTFSSSYLEARNKLTGVYGKNVDEISFDILSDDNTLTYVCNEKKPAFVKKTLDNPDDLARALILQENGEIAVLPLGTGDECRGTIVIVLDKYFSLAQRQMLAGIALHSSVALENSILYETARKESQEKSRLYNLASVMSSSLDLNEVLERSIDGVMSLIPSPETAWALIASYDEATNTICHEASRGGDNLFKHGTRIKLEGVLKQYFDGMINGTIKQIQDIEALSQKDSLPIYYENILDTFKPRSWLMIPLLVRGNPKGFLRICNKLPILPSEEATEALHNLGNNIAIAIDNARLYETAHRQSQEKSRLYNLAGAMSSSLEIKKVLDRALEGVMSLIPEQKTARAVILKYNEQDNSFIIVATRGVPFTDTTNFKFELPRITIDWFSSLSEGNAIMFSDIATQGDRCPDIIRKIMQSAGTRSLLSIPLMVRGRIVGALDIENRLPLLPDEGQVDALRNLANNIAIAMDNAMLYQNTKRQSEEQSRLYTLAGAMSSTLDIREVLGHALDGVISLVPEQKTATAFVVSYDEHKNCFRVVASSGKHEIDMANYTFDVSPTTLDWFIPLSQGNMMMFRDVVAPDVQCPEAIKERVQRSGFRSLLTIPLIVRGRFIGAMDVENRLPVLPDEVQIDALRNLANNVAIAMENANLYSKEKQRAVELQKLERLKTDFMLAISHELKTPLTSLSVSAGLLREEVQTSQGTPISRLLTGMVNSVDRLNRLVNDLLEAARLESSTMELNWEYADIVSSVKAAALAFAPMMEKKKQNFTLDVPPGLKAWVDLPRLEQIVANILSNAQKFTPEGGRITLVLKEENSDFVVQISDTGTGIPEDEQDRIFEPFYRATGAPRHTGSGLGLTIAKRLTQLHGGDIFITSAPGKGSIFIIRIPKGTDKEEKVSAMALV